ncbi:MAG: 2-succinyl-5-enolpyruvyl-6-hydroxy-3-cyclohexene-1-carboxylic-acid synthase [Bacteroidota bacterium]
MISSNKIIIQKIVSACEAFGISDVVICPGSRNAPLSIAFDNHSHFSTYVIHDERSAAYFALGMIDQLERPVAIVCTSGSAIQNISPAVSEAFYRHLPLVVISADRPKNWIDQGDGQTIRQSNVLKDHTMHVTELSDEINSDEYLWFSNRELNQAFSHTENKWKGPIHINVGLHEPLYDVQEIEKPPFSKIEFVDFENRMSEEILSVLRKSLHEKVLVLCGQMNGNVELQSLLSDFAQNTNVAILVENTSNLSDSRFVHCIDRTLNLISSDESEKFIPDLLITLGDAVVSKKIKTFLRKNKCKQHWKIGNTFPYMDTYQSVTHIFRMDSTSFFKQLLTNQGVINSNNYGSLWRQKDYLAKDNSIKFLESSTLQESNFSDMLVFDHIFQFIPKNTVLHMANSSVVRYCQLFDPIQGITYFGNRGTSGIDGSMSTAVGASVANYSKLHVFLSGDISFFYDSNGLWNKYLGKNFRIILINNSGGGIFRIIPGSSNSPQRDAFFEATHETNAKGICESFNVNYQSTTCTSDLTKILSEFFIESENERPKLLEIFTPRERNAEVLEEYFQFIKR